MVHRVYLFLAVVLFAAVGTSNAQHSDVLVTSVDGRITTDQRVYTEQFPSNFFDDDPGFNTSGASPLTPNEVLDFTFLSMNNGEGFRGNLLYWDGIGETHEDADFGPPPANHVFFITEPNDFTSTATVDGMDADVPGVDIGEVSASGTIHLHPNYFLLNDSGASTPEQGFYLLALQLNLAGQEPSLPFYLLYATSETTLATLQNLAEPWVEERIDTLVGGLEGDYNGDMIVDAADYAIWRDGGAGETEIEGYNAWAENFGSVAAASPVAVSSVTIPEPASWSLLLMAVASLCRRRGQCSA